MGFGKFPGNLMRQRIRERSQSYDLTRDAGGDTAGRFGEDATEVSGSTTTVTGVDLFLFNPSAAPEDTSFGDRLDGDLHAQALPGVDVEYGDRLTHGGTRYEVSSDPIGVPDDARPTYVIFSLSRVTNDR